jgi:RNA polymerase sigma-70 factor, ECF subfamily
MERAKAERLVEELFACWGPFLARYALQMTRSTEAADDIVQEAFLALYRDLRAGKAIRNPRSWTFGAVRNQVRKRTHLLVRHGEDLVTLEALDRLAAEPRWPDVAAEVTDESELTLSVLTEREKEVILLRLQSFKYREIAEQLGNSEKSVATLLARALHKLRKPGARGAVDSIAKDHVG